MSPAVAQSRTCDVEKEGSLLFPPNLSPPKLISISKLQKSHIVKKLISKHLNLTIFLEDLHRSRVVYL